MTEELKAKLEAVKALTARRAEISAELEKIQAELQAITESLRNER